MAREVVAVPPPSTSLAPGFRFHPTDDELVSYYLKRKVLGKPVRLDAIGEVDIYKYEPWDLTEFSRLKTRDQEWYFFSALDKKYGNGARMNRATNNGYWKATGKDREIRRDILLLGMKKTLVFHSGRAPDGLRTNWVMHEYRLTESETEKDGNLPQDAYVLCRVFHKNNIGPPSGNRYAPFIEEEWDGDVGGALIPGVDVSVSALPLRIANRTNQLTGKGLININELPREANTPTDIQHRNNSYDEEEETLKREHAEEDKRDALLPSPVVSKETPLPLLQYKRRRQNESDNNSSRITHDDHCSSTATTAISTLLGFSLMDISDKKENLPPYPPASAEERLHVLQKEIDEMSEERKNFKLEMMSAESMISILQSRIDTLRQENDELRKNNVKRE